MPDLTTEFVQYVKDLKTANITAKDVNTLVVKDLPTVIAAKPAEVDDRNTLYLAYLV